MYPYCSLESLPSPVIRKFKVGCWALYIAGQIQNVNCGFKCTSPESTTHLPEEVLTDHTLAVLIAKSLKSKTTVHFVLSG